MSKLDQGDKKEISAQHFAFAKQRKEPLEDASHVRNAIARFNQVEGVTDEERDESVGTHPRGGEKVQRGDE